MIAQYTIPGFLKNLMFVAFLVFMLFNIVVFWVNRNISPGIKMYRFDHKDK